jgi:hypothetical protein
MPAIKKDQAVSKLTDAIRALQPDDVADIYNELFPEAPSDVSSVKKDPGRFQKQIIDHIDKGLELEEILDLWRVLFPKDRRVHFDEETKELKYKEHGLVHGE